MEKLFSEPLRQKVEFDMPWGPWTGESMPVGLGGGMTPQTITVNNTVSLDGRTVARNQVQHFGEQLGMAGYA
jgi:hypothetical protein